ELYENKPRRPYIL
nr:Chain A, Neurotensin [Homo sapiens]2LNF_A Chain A, Neurotensin [Homo sapiens]2LNG_A Chain A, Neurotensin [Homo sapiens]prf//0605222A neurotensin [Homo sapiens]